MQIRPRKNAILVYADLMFAILNMLDKYFIKNITGKFKFKERNTVCRFCLWVAAHNVIDEALNNMSAKSLLSLLFPQAGDMCRALLSPHPPSPLLRALLILKSLFFEHLLPAASQTETTNRVAFFKFEKLVFFENLLPLPHKQKRQTVLRS